MFDEFLDSQFRISSAEELEYKLDDSAGYNHENVSKLISEAVFRSGRSAKIDVSSIFFAEQRRFVYYRM